MYDILYIGTSMIKHIRPLDLSSSIARVFVKSLSGALIKQLHNYIKKKKINTKLCKYFLLECGSNDCDTFIENKFEQIKDDFNALVSCIRANNPNLKLFVNSLVPRTTTRHSLLNFEANRSKLNSYYESLAENDDRFFYIKHDLFDDSNTIDKLLYDGVHMHPIYGVPTYLNEIKKYFSEFHPDIDIFK
jgi:hypothetical protein